MDNFTQNKIDYKLFFPAEYFRVRLPFSDIETEISTLTITTENNFTVINCEIKERFAFYNSDIKNSFDLKTNNNDLSVSAINKLQKWLYDNKCGVGVKDYQKMKSAAYGIVKAKSQPRYIIKNGYKLTYQATYIMKDKQSGFYKIGKSNRPYFRESTLQAQLPKIEVVKIFHKDIEEVLHCAYNNYRLRGEWFNLTKLQVRYICNHY